ncbi:MAG TPA: hypothetical protein VGO58_19840 [Chitinophagaceae bacterium]|jgi:hypothetical protein|nr:hypothetical protein [Chitinophagaceae bacterium]
MSKINDNLLVKGARGNLGKQFVYKKRGKNTHIAKMPVINKNLVPTARQLEVRELFAAASLYAKGAMTSPVLKKEYEKKAANGQTPFNIAFRDYLKAPVVRSIDTENYDGTSGSVIVVIARDDFRVAAVKVSIRDGAGVLIEEGNAILNPIDRNKWSYTTVQPNASPSGCTVSATALDLPGNKGTLEVTV